MEDFFRDTARIEAWDLIVYRSSVDGEAEKIPIRFGSRKAGLVAVSWVDSTSLQVTWTAGGTIQGQSFDVCDFKKAGARHVCLRCPECRRYRKKLYLFERSRTLFSRAPDPFEWVCEKCARENDNKDVAPRAKPAKRPWRSRLPAARKQLALKYAPVRSPEP